MHKFFESSHYNPRKYCRCILESKGYNIYSKTFPLCGECCLLLVFFCNSHLMIAWKSIYEQIDFLSCYVLQDFICEWWWNGSCTQPWFNPMKSTQILLSLVFLFWITIGLIQSDSSTGKRSIAFSILSIYCSTFSLYLGFILYLISIRPQTPKYMLVS